MLDGAPATDPYQNASVGSHYDTNAVSNMPVLVLCASEVVKVLETLSPQAIHSAHYSNAAVPVMRDVGHAFQDEYYSRPNTRFDMLKQALLQLVEPGTSAKDIHPCAEAWSDFSIRRDGSVVRQELLDNADDLQGLTRTLRLSIPQRAALRLCTGSLEIGSDDTTKYFSRWTQASTLTELFQLQLDQCQAATQTVDSMYWRNALSQLQQHHPFPEVTNDDTIVLSRPLQHIQNLRERQSKHCTTLEEQLGLFEKAYRILKRQIGDFTHSLEELRLKLWYTSEVVNSPRYSNARNVALALSHMDISKLRMTTSIDARSSTSLRPSSSRSVASSLFSRGQDDTMDLLKAPTEHGGPRKLADGQIEKIKQWLHQYNIDNFCKGEERFHRFCMEVFLLVRKLTGDSLLESEELWSSALFARERSYYEIQTYATNSAPASTRPASVISDLSGSFTYSGPHTALRSIDSDVRSNMSDDRSSHRRGSVYNLFQRSLNPHLLTPSLASSMSSYGRTSSGSTAASDVVSLAPTSVTSASVMSRPGSILQGGLPNFGLRPVSSAREKKKFRDQLRKGLTCLLLSDLGSLIWSWGCETDKWVTSVQGSSLVMDRFGKRLTNELLVGSEVRSKSNVTRRQSTSQVPDKPISKVDAELPEIVNEEGKQADKDYDAALQDILIRLSQQIDPIGKLQACVDLNTLAVEQLEVLRSSSSKHARRTKADGGVRRKSLGEQFTSFTEDSAGALSRLSVVEGGKFTEPQIMHHLKQQLARLRPETIFRDLQYIAVFAPTEMLDKTVAGKAFMNIGMAAIQYKLELCGSMVDVADQTVAASLTKGRWSLSAGDQPLSRAADYWKTAALEGDRVAQRELALLFLMRPELVPVVTMPLSLSAEIFKDDMMWRKRTENNSSRQALCLALHWMQLAAQNGDKIAQKKLEERDGGLSIR